ncbi:MAG: response regulator [Bryobacteraceae bacterium]
MTVLVADDSERSRELLSAVLGHLGFTVIGASTGTQALALAERHRPCLAILDIRMPGLDGYQTAQAIRGVAGLGGIPIIALTASAREEDRDRAISAGFTRFYTKPMDLSALRRAILDAIPASAVAASR